MKQGDFALKTNGQGVYTPTQTGSTGVYQCDGLTSAFEIDAQGGRIGASFTPNRFEDVTACTVTGVYLPDPPGDEPAGSSVTYDNVSVQYVKRPAPMTLNEIVAAVRTNELVTGRDMRYAIVAFDVLMSQLHIDQHVEQLQEYFKAAEAPPREYAGHMNDPENPEAVEWYKAMQGVSGS